MNHKTLGTRHQCQMNFNEFTVIIQFALLQFNETFAIIFYKQNNITNLQKRFYIMEFIKRHLKSKQTKLLYEILDGKTVRTSLVNIQCMLNSLTLQQLI